MKDILILIGKTAAWIVMLTLSTFGVCGSHHIATETSSLLATELVDMMLVSYISSCVAVFFGAALLYVGGGPDETPWD